MNKVQLKANTRESYSKGSAKRLRREGFIPAVVYGKDKQPVSVQIQEKEFKSILKTRAGENVLINLKLVNQNGEEEKTVMIKDIQEDVVNRDIIHADFYQISMNDMIQVKIPILITGTSEGIKAGGVLQHQLRELEIECLPTEIPDNVEIDITPMEIADVLRVDDLSFAENVRVLTSGEEVIVALVPPATVKEVETAVEEPVTEKKEKTAE